VQQRPGLDEKPFNLIKFSTMYDVEPGKDEAEMQLERLTPVGRYLRTWSLDELPQLFNVLKGEMSLVGPRPLLKEYLPLYSDHQRKRHNVRPGVTGWAQVNGRNAISWEMKFDLDVWYVENHNIRLDCSILFKTLVSVIRRDGITYENQATTTPFQGSTTHR